MKNQFYKYLKLIAVINAIRTSRLIGITSSQVTSLLPVSDFRELANHNPNLAEKVLAALIG